ncbi:tRNA (guanine-N(7)-)-methyltransferase [Bacteroidia bacterium]|nr:tRNA (guanine-N(7)-)-methyltransferase [Bacteroidia bacterium]
MEKQEVPSQQPKVNSQNLPGARPRVIRSFGRIRGKKLSARQSWLVSNLLPQIRVSDTDFGHEKKTESEIRIQNPILEIGFGAGEHLLHLATANPDSIILGAEPFINGVASLLSKISNYQLAITNSGTIVKPEYQNIRIWPDDVRKLFSFLSSLFSNPNMRFAQIWILHPDPWPKARHEKRRLLSVDFLKALGEFLSPGGQIIIGTDHCEYFDWIVANAKLSQLKINNEKPAIIETRYQKKNMAGTDGTKYLVLEKNLDG